MKSNAGLLISTRFISYEIFISWSLWHVIILFIKSYLKCEGNKFVLSDTELFYIITFTNLYSNKMHMTIYCSSTGKIISPASRAAAGVVWDGILGPSRDLKTGTTNWDIGHIRSWDSFSHIFNPLNWIMPNF